MNWGGRVCIEHNSSQESVWFDIQGGLCSKGLSNVGEAQICLDGQLQSQLPAQHVRPEPEPCLSQTLVSADLKYVRLRRALDAFQ